MTLESRAARVLHEAGELGLTIGPGDAEHWHGLIVAALRTTLTEARVQMVNVGDQIALDDMMRDRPAGKRAGRLMPCPLCGGTPGGCGGCNFSGAVVDGGPVDPRCPGRVAYKPCGCAIDWLADSAAPDTAATRERQWKARGLRVEAMPLAEAMEQIRQGATCDHDTRTAADPGPASPAPAEHGGGA